MGIFDPQGIPSSPTSKQIVTPNIAPWAQPYISNYLTKAQQLVDQGAQPNALMQQAASSAANLQIPGQFSQGSQLAQQGGQGMLGTTGAALGYGGLGSLLGMQASQAGQNYAQQATNPAAVGAYMNPYLQQSLAPQLQMLGQQESLAGQGIAARAVGQGAFGGNRATLAQGLNAQNYDLARQQAIGQAYNQAFQQAQQAQQFGAQLGLQGLQAGMQGQQIGLQGVGAAQQGYQGATQAGAALGNIGAQQNAANLGILGLQNQLGLQQYNLPYQQLQFAQSMLQGLPVAGGTTQGYQAGPNALSQMSGLGITALGGYGLYKDLTRGSGGGGGGGSGSIGGGGGGSYMENPTSWADNRDIGMNEGSGVAAMIPGETLGGSSVGSFDSEGNFVDFAKGGSVKSYATGGLVKLALDKALRGAA